MPLLTLDEVQGMSPIFHGKTGAWFGKALMRCLRIDGCNALYDRNSHLKGPAFARAVLNDIGVRYEILNPEILDTLPDGPFITVSNHPYGGLDGIILVDLFGHLRPDYKVMVNKFLSRVKALEDSFICVTPNGNQRNNPTSESICGVKESLCHVRNGYPIGLFPAGAVSDLSLKDRCVRDREWQESVIRLIRRMNVPVLPVRFLDRNTDFYYSLGLIDWKVRVLRLPSEVLNKSGKTVRVSLGPLIPVEELASRLPIEVLSDFLRAKVYDQK